ncbi:hypothetical protein DFS33DRAFT_1352865, partial [Desarmillaria ectypa]
MDDLGVSSSIDNGLEVLCLQDSLASKSDIHHRGKASLICFFASSLYIFFWCVSSITFADSRSPKSLILPVDCMPRNFFSSVDIIASLEHASLARFLAAHCSIHRSSQEPAARGAYVPHVLTNPYGCGAAFYADSGAFITSGGDNTPNHCGTDDYHCHSVVTDTAGGNTSGGPSD